MKPTMRSFTVNLEPWQLQKLKLVAGHNERTVGFEIRRAIQIHLRNALGDQYINDIDYRLPNTQ